MTYEILHIVQMNCTDTVTTGYNSYARRNSMSEQWLYWISWMESPFLFSFFILQKMYTEKRISLQTCSHFHIYDGIINFNYHETPISDDIFHTCKFKDSRSLISFENFFFYKHFQVIKWHSTFYIPYSTLTSY